MTAIVEIKHFHFFCGLGGGAKGFNEGEARVAELTTNLHTSQEVEAQQRRRAEAAEDCVVELKQVLDKRDTQINTLHANIEASVAERDAALVKVEALEIELRNIANAKQSNFADAEEFRSWAQNRARHTLEYPHKAVPRLPSVA